MTRCWISQGYLLRFLGYPGSRKDIPKSENLKWDIPKLQGIFRCKCRVSFVVLGYLSLPHPILVQVPILFSTMQLVARKSCQAQPNDCYILLTTSSSPSTCILTSVFTFSCPSHTLPVQGTAGARQPHAPPAQLGGELGSAIGIALTPSASA
jgi:hypothetical protein